MSIYLACRNCNKQKPLSQLKEPLCSACLSVVICTKCNLKKPASAYTTAEGKEKSVCNACSLHSIKDSFSESKNDDVSLTLDQSSKIDNIAHRHHDEKVRADSSSGYLKDFVDDKKVIRYTRERLLSMRHRVKSDAVRPEVLKVLDGIGVLKCKNSILCDICHLRKPKKSFTKTQKRNINRMDKACVCIECKSEKKPIVCVSCNEVNIWNGFPGGGLLPTGLLHRLCKQCLYLVWCSRCKMKKHRNEFPKQILEGNRVICKGCAFPDHKVPLCLYCCKEKEKHDFTRDGWMEQICKECNPSGLGSDCRCKKCKIMLPFGMFFINEIGKRSKKCFNCKSKSINDNSVLSDFDNERKVLSSMDKESRKRPREDVDATEIGPVQKIKKQNTIDEKADNNITSSTSQGLSISLEPKLVLFRCTKESMWWPALASTSMQNIIKSTKIDTKVKLRMLKMSREALKSNTKQQDCKLVHIAIFLAQHHPEDQQPMHIISKDQQHDLVCDFFDQLLVCENEEGPRGRAVDLAISWGCDSEDDTVELVERDISVCSEALQKRVDEATVQIGNQNERLKKLEEEKNEYAKKAEETRMNLTRIEQENNDCKMKAKQQSKSIKQLEDEKTLLKQKIEKLTELKDLSDGLKAELECPICLDPFDNPYMNPECGHRFCYRCIQQAISKSGKECPLCRVKITSKRGLRKDELIRSITDVVFRDDNECIEIN